MVARLVGLVKAFGVLDGAGHPDDERRRRFALVDEHSPRHRGLAELAFAYGGGPPHAA